MKNLREVWVNFGTNNTDVSIDSIKHIVIELCKVKIKNNNIETGGFCCA